MPFTIRTTEGKFNYIYIGNFLVTADSSFFTQLLNKKNALSSEIVIWSDKFEATKDAGK